MATATGAGKAGTAVVDQAAVERLVAENAALQGERDAAIAERDRLIEASGVEKALLQLAEVGIEQDPDPRGWRPGVVIDALCQVAKEVGGVPKVFSPELGYSVRGLGPIMDKAQPAMAEHGLVILPDDVEDVSIEGVEVGDRKKIWRHVDTKWHWRIWHRSGAWIPLVTFGEARDGGDKGRNKAQSGAYKYAVVAALSLAEQNDPDSTTPPEREHPGGSYSGGGGGPRQAAPPAEMPAGLTKSQQARWQWEQQQRQKAGGSQPAPAPTPAPAPEQQPEPAPEQLPVTHASRDPEPSASASTAEGEAEQTREELRERIASIEAAPPASAPAEAPETGSDGSDSPAAPETPDPGPEASEVPSAPRGYWPCNRCGEVVSGHVGDPCPVCRKGELYDGRMAEDEPFAFPPIDRGDDAPVRLRHRWAPRRGDGRWPGQF